MSRAADMEAFALEYLRTHVAADACNVEFQDAFQARFYGVGRVGERRALRASAVTLRTLWRRGVVTRGRISIGSSAPEFPRWVYSYVLPQSAVQHA